MKGMAPSCCVARDTSGSGSSGSGAKEPKDIDHDHFTHTSPPGADLQSARLDQCEKRDDTGRHLRLAQRGQSGAQALSALDRDEPRARSHRPRFRRDWAGVGDEGFRGPRGHGSGRQGRDVRLVHVSRAPVRPGDHVALLAPREAERRQDSLRPVSRGHLRYLGNPRASAILTLRRLEHSKRPGATMNKDLGVWTNQDCALVLIDYQTEIFATIRSETSAALAELNVRLLARTAKAFNMPIVLSTVGVPAHGDRAAGTRRRRPEYRARGPVRAVPRLDVTAGRQGAPGHRLVFRGNPEADRRSGCVDRKSTRLNSSHSQISYAVFCLKK